MVYSLNKITQSNNFLKLSEKFYINTPSFYKNICQIIEKNPDKHWSNHMINCVKEIATNNAILEIDDPILTEPSIDSFSIETKALNCVRGKAIFTISQLLHSDKNYYSVFKDCISELVNDTNPVIRYATLRTLSPIYNIDKRWALDKMMKIFSEDYTMIKFTKTRDIFYYCYSDHQRIINRIIRNAMNTDESRLLETCGYLIVDIYVHYDDFNDILHIYLHNAKLQKHIIKMLVQYFKIDKFREKCKHLLLQILNSNGNINEHWIWRNLLNEDILNVKKDADIINMISSSNLHPKTFRDFSEFACKKKDIKY